MSKPSVFVSYARDDDEPFVERLHKGLGAAGIDVWWDRKAMESRGRSFLQEIRDAIEGVDRLIAVIGPKAVALCSFPMVLPLPVRNSALFSVP